MHLPEAVSMGDQGFMMINAQNGAIIATIEDDAQEAGRYAEMVFERFGKMQVAQRFAIQMNTIYAEETGRRRILSDNAFFPNGEDDDAAAGNYMAALRDAGFYDAAWAVTTWDGGVYPLTDDQRPPFAKRARPVARSVPAKRKTTCTCQRR